MLRKLLITAASFAFAGSALAADLPARTAPMGYAAPIFSWTGLYVGVNAGASRSMSKITDTDYYNFGGSKETTKTDFTGGAQIGYNWQMGALVLGLETDINYLNSDVNNVDQYDAFRSKSNYLGTVRGRVGVAVDRALVYVTGGLAYGKINNGYGYYCDTNCNTFNGYSDTFVSNKTRTGYVVGAGVEYAFTQNISFKVEGLYADLGENTTACGTCGNYRVKFDNTATIGRVGVNYRF
ncbi:MAG: hypothetical protein JWN07_3266 [Hyphomicrobiales bacterium]|nr:hypothetical protein [Hyphomicrobiales bacterium]